MDVLERIEDIECETCKGTGKEICDNPDHGFLGAISFTDTGRIGCPCCGHDENHAITNTVCENCNGTGKKFIVNYKTIELAKLGKRMQWVSVADDLPKDYRRMWAYDGKHIYVARYCIEKQIFYDIEGSLFHIHNFHKEIKNVTHYMLVPPNPGKGDHI